MKLILSFVMALLFCVSVTKTSQAQITDTTITVKVNGIGCASDVKSIENRIIKLEGVLECKLGKQGATTTYVIKFNPSLVKEEDINATIENTAGCKNPDDRPYKVKRKKKK